jgi:AhpD family alkylhydroperoxidase
VARLEPLPPQQWPDTMRAAIAALRTENPRHPILTTEGDRPKALNALGTFAHHPGLTRAYHTFVGHLLYDTTLSLPQRELVILRVAAVRGCEYEWLQHVVIGGDVGLSEDEIAAARAGADTPLLRAVDELLADARVSDATWAALSAELDTQQLLDLVFTVGAYDLLAMVFLTFEVPIDDDLAKWKRPSPK